MCDKKGDRDKMLSLKDRLAEANEKIELRLDDIWKKAEQNLKQAESDFYKRNGKGNKD